MKTPKTKKKNPHLNQKAFLTASIHGGHILCLILYLVLTPIHFGLANIVINNYVFHNSLLCLNLFLSQTEQKFEYRERISWLLSSSFVTESCVVLKIQKVLQKVIRHHVLPLVISLTGGDVCSRQMVLLGQDQHLLGEYFYNGRWVVLVDKGKFFGCNPQR